MDVVRVVWTSHDHPPPHPGRLTRVEVAIPAREAAAGDLKPQPVAGAQEIARRPEVDVVLRRPAGLAPDPEDPIGKVDRAAVRIDVAQAGDAVGRGGARAGPDRGPAPA